MSKQLKVFSWIWYRPEASGTHHQTREMVAAASKAEVARIAGVDRPSQLHNLSEMGGFPLAMAEPGVIFWRPLNGLPWDDYWRVDPETGKSQAVDMAGRNLIEVLRLAGSIASESVRLGHRNDDRELRRRIYEAREAMEKLEAHARQIGVIR